MRVPRRVRAVAVAATAVGLALSMAVAADASSTPAHEGDGHNGRAFDHIYVIMLENHSKSSVIGDKNAPHLNELASDYGMAANYYGVTHPSMPNYIASVAGDNFGIQDDNDQNVVNLDRRNLVDQLEAAHISWGAYMQTLPENKLDRFGPTVAAGTDADPKQPGVQIALYAKKHNPFVLFDDVKDNPDRMSHIKDYSALGADLDGGHAPKFVWISPNQCNDMHGGVNDAVAGHPETPCPYAVTKDDAHDVALKQKADAFVEDAVTTIMQSRAWTERSAIVIVTDENDFVGAGVGDAGGWENADACCDSPYVPAADPRVSAKWPGGTYGGGLIPAIVVTASGPRHFVDDTPYNHYSLLTTIEDNWRLGHIGHAGDTAGGVVPMWPLFADRD